MKAKALFLFLLCSVNVGISQSSIRLYWNTKCGNEILPIAFFNVEKDSVVSHSDSTGMALVANPGAYRIRFLPFLEEGDPQLDKIYGSKEGASIVDTLNMYAIVDGINTFDRTYLCCGKECEGKQTDYFSNGKIRIEGTFKNGRPVGIFKTYYMSGRTKQFCRYSSKSSLRKRILYDREGRIT